MKTSKITKIIHTMSALALTATFSAGATIDFDSLAANGGGVPVPLGYGGFTWNNFSYLNPQISQPVSGYAAGMVSANHVAFNAFGNPASLSATEPFDLVSAYITGAWNHNLEVTVTAFNGPTEVASQTVTTSAYAPTLFTFNFNNITSVVFSSLGGTDAPEYSGSGTHFALDNLVVSTVPEPAAAGMTLLGLALVMRRRRTNVTPANSPI